MLAQQIFNGLILGCIYALLAVGYSLVFGILRLLNMSHGAIYTFGAFMSVLGVSLNMGTIGTILFAVITTGILNLAVNKAILEPLRNKGAANITMLISVTGVSYIVQNALMLIFGSERIAFPRIFDYGSFKIGDVLVTSTQVAIIVITVLLLLTLGYITKYTKLGLAMRCISQNLAAANMVGVDVKRIISITFIMSGMCAALAGFMISGYYEITFFTMGTTAGLKAFAAAVLGGIGILSGSVVGGIIVGLCEALATVIFGGEYSEATAYIILFLVLLFKPSGIFGKKNNIEKI